MNKSETISNLTAALVKAQAAFPPVPRTKEVIVQTNKGAYAFKYATLESMIAIVRPILATYGLGFVQGANGDTLETTLIHESGEWIQHTMPLTDPGTAQAYGAQITYKRRYALKSALGIETDDDNSEEDHSPKPPKGKPSAPITPSAGAWDGIPPERAEILRRIGSGVMDYYDSGDIAGAVKYWEEQKFEDENEKIAVWALFGSKMRSAMKRHKQLAALKGDNGAQVRQ